MNIHERKKNPAKGVPSLPRKDQLWGTIGLSSEGGRRGKSSERKKTEKKVFSITSKYKRKREEKGKRERKRNKPSTMMAFCRAKSGRARLAMAG